MTCIEMDFFPANFMLQTTPHEAAEDHHNHHHHHHHHHQPPPPSTASLSPMLPSCSSQDFHGVASLLGKRGGVTFSGVEMCTEEGHGGGGEDELSDDGSHLGVGEKKRRLNMEQVKTLEKNFELGNKLEPERKMQLARALGLQPRQIAIWFQNRRARWKTKQLEKDYELLKRQFEAVKAENDALQAHNQKLQAQIMALKNRDHHQHQQPTESINLNKETEGSCSNENSSDNIKLAIDNHHHPHHESPLSSRTLFPPAIRGPAPPYPPPSPAGVVAHQLFQVPSSSSRPDLHDHHNFHHKMYNNNHQTSNNNNVKEESSLSNMFAGIEDQTGFWPWLEQPHFN